MGRAKDRRRTISDIIGKVGGKVVEAVDNGMSGTMHVKRLLTAAELRKYGIGGVKDLRGSPEAVRRLEAARSWLQKLGIFDYALAELGLEGT